jgi:hypothetical protein
VQYSKVERPMSALGQKQTWRDQIAMSALPLKADIDRWHREVCFVPISDINATQLKRSAARQNPSKGLTNTVGIGGHPLRPEQA